MAADRAYFLTLSEGEVVSSTKTFPYNNAPIYTGGMDGTMMVQVAWDNANPVDMDLELLVGTDPNMPFVSPTDSLKTISDASGSHIWDIFTGASHVKVKVTVRSGSATFKIKLVGKDL